jgi:hypothetical protein
MDLESIRQTAFRVMSERMPGERKEPGNCIITASAWAGLCWPSEACLSRRRQLGSDAHSRGRLHDVSFGSEDHARLARRRRSNFLRGAAANQKSELSAPSYQTMRTGSRTGSCCPTMQSCFRTPTCWIITELMSYGMNSIKRVSGRLCSGCDGVVKSLRFENCSMTAASEFRYEQADLRRQVRFIRAFYTRFAVEGAAGYERRSGSELLFQHKQLAGIYRRQNINTG